MPQTASSSIHYLGSHVVFPLLVGGTIYLLFREYWYLDLLSWAPVETIDLAQGPPDWVKYQLPDGLWLYSALRFQQWVWREGDGRWRRRAMGSLIGLAVGTECLQLLGMMRGTGDWGDILCYLLAGLLCMRPISRHTTKFSTNT